MHTPFPILLDVVRVAMLDINVGHQKASHFESEEAAVRLAHAADRHESAPTITWVARREATGLRRWLGLTLIPR